MRISAYNSIIFILNIWSSSIIGVLGLGSDVVGQERGEDVVGPEELQSLQAHHHKGHEN